MKDTKIEWCDSTVNPTGFQCQGCELWMPARGVKECYAGRFAERIGGVGAFDKPVELKPGRMAEAARWSDLRGKPRAGKPWIPAEYPRIIFIGDMADTFQKGVEFRYLCDEVMDNVTSPLGRRHIWMWLTKDAKRLEKFSDLWTKELREPWPKNLWPGVSVTSNQTLWRVEHLLKVPAARRFVSYEPAWEWVDFSRIEDEDGNSLNALTGDWGIEGRGHTGPSQERIHQVIIGGESGAGAAKHPFNVEWPRKLIGDCANAGVACFVKQFGARVIESKSSRDGLGHISGNILLRHKKGGDWLEWEPALRVRKFPALP